MLNIYFDIYVVALLSRRRGGQLLYIVPYTVSHLFTPVVTIQILTMKVKHNHPIKFHIMER